MRTRRRNQVKKGTRKKNPRLNQLLEEYNDALVELETKKKRFNAEYKECQKWRRLRPTFFGLKPKNYTAFDADIYHVIQGHERVENKIKEIRDDIVKIHKEWIHVHSICQVSYRLHFGLLHTLPPKKMNMIETVYPDIRHEMVASKQKRNRTISKPVIPQKVRFNTFVFKKSQT